MSFRARIVTRLFSLVLPRGKRRLLLWAVNTLSLLIAAGANANDSSRPPFKDATEMSLEDLLQVEVTSVSKKAENLQDAAAAISVLSNDDLRRSGATSIAEALRVVPGVNVGSLNSSTWAVSARGHNGPYANKLLVLVDGRVVYTPSFAGVYWNLQQTMLEDVDRIEVIRGPGATLWGANAVNGVINIVTRSAKETQGGLVYAGGGDVHQALTGARYGQQVGENTYYRMFGSYQLNDDYPMADGRSAHDGWQGVQGGFRLDNYSQSDAQLTWQSDATLSDFNDHTSTSYNLNTLGRWTREVKDRSSVQVQAYIDRTYLDEPTRTLNISDTFDLSAQHTFGLGERNDIIWGLGAQYIHNTFGQNTPAILIPTKHTEQKLFSIFLQDAFQVMPDKVTLTVGTKLEHNDFTGFELEPSLRLAVKPTEHQTVWAAASRAVRTPSVLEGRNVFEAAVGDPFVGPDNNVYVPRLIGNDRVRSEVLWAFELGYRLQASKKVSIDLATFYNHYDNLITWSTVPHFVPGNPGTAELFWGNLLRGENYGGEVSVTISPIEKWRLTANYSLLFSKIEGVDPANTEGSSPKHQATLRSSWDFTRQISVDGQLRYVDKIAGVPAYITADLRLAYRPMKNLELALVGQNLLQARHREEPPAFFLTAAEVPRGVYGKVTWWF